ncbi:MAG TPA: ribosome silencing factor [Chloroflexota bacterium]|jgi:ribosome-associated protein|nr:ribosome silencing factor [Chloroflexota bacterium]
MSAEEHALKPRRLDPDALARRIVDIASDKQAVDIVLLDLRPLTVIADYFVICSGGSERQLQAIQRDITETLRNEDRIRPAHVEGTPDSGWVLMDYSDVVVHIFSPAQRQYYDLEELWSAAHPVVRIQ